MAGSVVHGNVPRYCLKSRVCNVYLQLLASEERLYFVELIASNNIEHSSGHNPQKGYTIISFSEGVT